MDNPEKLSTQVMQEEDRQIKDTTQYVLGISNPDVHRRAHVLVTLFVFACA
jgi:hypothetical protein